MTKTADVDAIIRFDGQVMLRILEDGVRVAVVRSDFNAYTQTSSKEAFWEAVESNARDILSEMDLSLGRFRPGS